MVSFTSPVRYTLNERPALHGAWGLNITWNDGHRTGIFPFDALRRWSDGGPAFGPDSGLRGT